MADGVFNNQTKAFIITMMNNHASTVAARKCLQSIKNTSSKINPFIIDATTPEVLNDHLKQFGLTTADWSYPKSPAETRRDLNTGLTITGYRSDDLTKVISCLVSHMRLWRLCHEMNEAIIVLEHDALFTRSFDIEDIVKQFNGSILGLNDPRGATRKSSVYHTKLRHGVKPDQTIYDIPWVDDDQLTPQGIAGNSAYLVTPTGAAKLLAKVREIGMWPNDALMCKQFFLGLKQVFPYYTQVQGLKSTTTL